MGSIKIGQFKKILIKAKKVAIDSSIFIYHFVKKENYSKLTSEIFESAEKGVITLSTSTISIIEIFVKPEEEKNQALLIEYDKILKNFPNLTIKTIDYPTARLAAKLRGKYKHLKTPDTLQIAAALMTESQVFITNDHQLKQIEEIRIHLLKDFL